MTTAAVLAAVVACVVSVVTCGFAASNGMTTGGLGADSKAVASCGTGMTIGYTTAFDPAISGHAVNGIDLANIPAGCLRETLSLTFYDGSHDAVGSAITATLPASGTTEGIPIDPSVIMIDASRVSGVSIVVS